MDDLAKKMLNKGIPIRCILKDINFGNKFYIFDKFVNVLILFCLSIFTDQLIYNQVSEFLHYLDHSVNLNIFMGLFSFIFVKLKQICMFLFITGNT